MTDEKTGATTAATTGATAARTAATAAGPDRQGAADVTAPIAFVVVGLALRAARRRGTAAESFAGIAVLSLTVVRMLPVALVSRHRPSR